MISDGPLYASASAKALTAWFGLAPRATLAT
jgi:hypothetical protein